MASEGEVEQRSGFATSNARRPRELRTYAMTSHLDPFWKTKGGFVLIIVIILVIVGAIVGGVVGGRAGKENRRKSMMNFTSTATSPESTATVSLSSSSSAASLAVTALLFDKTPDGLDDPPPTKFDPGIPEPTITSVFSSRILGREKGHCCS